MKIEITINPSESTEYEFAKVNLNCVEYPRFQSILDVEFTNLYKKCRLLPSIALDFLFFSSIVYVVDKLIPREKITKDNWTRDLKLNIPVSDPDKWALAIDNITDCLSFLTGDNWGISFSERKPSLYRPKKRRRRRHVSRIQADAVCLFSGGLDSLIGAIDWLELNDQGRLLLVGHHDLYGGPKSDQERVFKIIKDYYKNRIDLLQVRVGQDPSGEETTFRSRSLIFIALGICAARSMGNDIPLLIPENGAIALNVPLTPSRRGSCSTRTVHPYFLKKLRQILTSLGIENPLYNPLEFKTKGECVEQCLNQEVFRVASLESVSCAKHGHKRTWLRPARACGFCIPCIYRRAALHKIHLDSESYGRDICEGEVDLESGNKLPSDFRAIASFLIRNFSEDDIAALLMANGPIESSKILQYSKVVCREMDEVRELLRDKASDEIKQRIGIT